MKFKKDIAIMIYGRLNSKRCPKKMIKKFCNSSLLEICIKKLLNSKIIPNSNIYCGVYEKPLINLIKKYPINIFKRSKTSAMSEGKPVSSYYEFWDKIPQKYVIFINACCPLISKKTIENFYKSYLKTKSNGLLSVIKKKNYIWSLKSKLLTEKPIKNSTMNTKFLKGYYETAHVLQAGKLSDIGKNVWMGSYRKKNDPELKEIPEEETFDIDYEWQFKVAEKLYSRK